MTFKNSWVRLLVRGAAVVVVLTAAVLVWNRLPYPVDVEAPFYAHGTVGQKVDTPTIELTVAGAKVGNQLKTRNALIKSTGHWIMIDGTVTALRGPGYASANLVIGDRTYFPSERAPFGTFQNAARPLAAGITQRGAWVFEVPNDALESGPAELRVWVGTGSAIPRFFPRIPSVSVPLDDGHAPRVQTIIPPNAIEGAQ
ncbi:hypothetical protein FZI91_14905 [Mycobacterium sp. CBMA271]|uniref:hypothetical protein n=1 Tax=unclassified Mycobacteroides TaxID=2618759 RepID=UPI0012DEA62D|nr:MULTISPECIES: hypothetical protein [unclassified Mycobacteroides]MUM17739.1 hypothetical protein [Mycobacteroides sp. CBMA 326]MUM22986.1 hypothetical protein [Mycobacteroides sp. CBMA 271]